MTYIELPKQFALNLSNKAVKTYFLGSSEAKLEIIKISFSEEYNDFKFNLKIDNENCELYMTWNYYISCLKSNNKGE